jgi:DNA-binding response OmpR family regulator
MKKENKKIIIVDDDKIFLETMASVLRLSDFDVYEEQTAESGFEAIITVNPDLVLLDINLPDKSGFEVLTAIKKSDKFSELPVFLITGDTAMDVDKAFEKGADDCLFKPINSEDAIKRIKKVLGK